MTASGCADHGVQDRQGEGSLSLGETADQQRLCGLSEVWSELC